MSKDDIGGGLTYIETRNKIAAIREAKLAEVIAERDKLRERCDAYKGQVEAGASEIARLTAQVERMKDGDEYNVDQYKAFWKAYEELPEGEGKWNAWATGITAMMAVPFSSDERT